VCSHKKKKKKKGKMKMPDGQISHIPHPEHAWFYFPRRKAKLDGETTIPVLIVGVPSASTNDVLAFGGRVHQVKDSVHIAYFTHGNAQG
jgi:hypothetical protein